MSAGLWILGVSAQAGPVEVLDARAQCSKSRTCAIQATLRHGDEGWEHYANRWEVLTQEGEVVAIRELRHPHVKEQPFTRALRGVKVPEGITRVRIRARDSVHGYGEQEFSLDLEFPE